MIKETVFVIGAGASFEAGLPTGDGLKSEISKLLYSKRTSSTSELHENVDRIIRGAIFEHASSTNALCDNYFLVAKHISNALPLSISIDNLLDEHRDNKDEIPLCGKLAIARAILEAERKSKLYINNSNIYNKLNFSNIGDTWYVVFFKLLTEKCEKNELKSRFKSITLIIFNYDRCVEHFIYNALLEKYYSMSKSEAAELVKSIRIYHPYGVVGAHPLDQVGHTTSGDIVDFGEEVGSSKLLELSRKIKTFTEEAESSERMAIKSAMQLAERLVFLGFAFHEINMELIKPDFSDGKKPIIECLATAFAVSESNRQIMGAKIKELYSGNIGAPAIENITCFRLFGDFSMRLSF